MKKLLIALALLIGLSVQASNITTNITGNATNSVFQIGAEIYKLTLANAGTNAVTVTFFDAPTNSLTYSNTNTYTGVVSYTTNIVVSYTNILGVVESQTNSYVYNAPTTVAGFTNQYRILTTVVVPAGTTSTYQPAYPLRAAQGLLITNNTPGAGAGHILGVNVDYGTLIK